MSGRGALAALALLLAMAATTGVLSNSSPGRRTLTWELDPPFLRARAISTVQVVR